MENNSNSLAKIAIGLNVVLIIAVIFLFVKMPSGGSEQATSELGTDTSSTAVVDDGILRIGYFNADSLSSNLLIMTEIQGELDKAQTDAQAKMDKKQRDLNAWQSKWQNRGTLLPSEEEQYMREAQQKQQEAMMFEQNVQLELAQKQEMLMFTYVEKISNFSRVYAEKEGFDYIFSYQMGQGIFYGSPNMDVTEGMIELMNEDYQEMQGDSSEEEEGETEAVENEEE